MKRVQQVQAFGNHTNSTGDLESDCSSSISRAVRHALHRRVARVAPGIAALMAASLAAHAQTAVSDDEQTASKQDKLSQVVVTARRRAIQSADELKKNSESIIDSVLADDAGKLPDVSITEVLQRVPGVSISRWIAGSDAFNAEGSGVQVRGLSGVAGRVNGREVFSANGGHGLSWTDVPPELMAGVDVYKTATADLIEGGTGGQIDLRTKMPFDFHAFNAQATASEDYADFGRLASPTGSLLLADTVETEHLGKIGAMVDLSYGKYTSRADYISAEPFYQQNIGGVSRYIAGGFNYGITKYWRTRKGAYAALQWKPTDSVELSQTYWESKYTEYQPSQAVFLQSHNLAIDPAGHNVIDAGGAVLASDSFYQYDPKQLGVSSGTVYTSGDTNVSRKAHDTRDLSTQLKISPASGRWTLRAAFQRVDASVNEVGYNVFPTIPLSPGTYGADFTGVGQISVPASVAGALADPSQYFYSATMDTAAINSAHMNAYNTDVDCKLSDSGFFRSVQAGARYADHTESDSGAYNWQALGAGWNGYPPVSFANGRPGDYAPSAFDNFFQGRSAVPNVLLPSLALVSRMDVLADHLLYGNPLKTTAQTDPTNIAHVRYKDTALYGLVRFANDTGLFNIPIRGNFGVRMVRTQHVAQGSYQQSAASYSDPATGVVYDLPQTPLTPLSGGRSDTKVLPSLNLLFAPSEAWQTRLSFSMTMDNPDVNSIKANGSLGVSTSNVPGSPQGTPGVFNGWNVTFGNPNLRPVISRNFDLSEEWYPKPGTAVHVAPFYKSISNWLVNSSTSQQWPVVFSTGTQLTTVNYNGTYNSSQLATIKGVELGGHTYFDILPGPLRGFGIDATYTFIDSKNPGDLSTDIFGNIHNNLPIQGLSRHNANFALLYDYKWWSARLAYNWRSEQLLGSNIGGLNASYDYFSANTPNSSDDLCRQATQSSCQYRKLQLPLFSPAYGQLDLGVTLRPSEHYYVSFQVANLTNQMTRSKQAGYPSGELPRQWWITDRRFNLAAGVKF